MYEYISFTNEIYGSPLYSVFYLLKEPLGLFFFLFIFCCVEIHHTDSKMADIISPYMYIPRMNEHQLVLEPGIFFI